MQTGKAKRQQSFKEYLKLNHYAPNSQEKYMLSESLLPQTLNQKTINDFIMSHNTPFIRSFLRLYLFDYLRLDEKGIEIPKFVSIHKKLPSPKEILYFEEVKKVLDETEDLDVKLCIRMGFIPGLRVTEMVGDTHKSNDHYISPLTPSSIDFQRLTVFGTGKGNKDYMQPINEATGSFLKLYIKKYKLKDNDRFFDTTRQTLLNHVKQECNEIVGKHIFIHSLRSSLGTYLVECNWNPIAIKEFLRHEKLETIMKYIILSRKHINESWNKTEWL